MRRIVDFDQAALLEAREARLWYYARSPRAEERFRRELDRAIETIREAPPAVAARRGRHLPASTEGLPLQRPLLDRWQRQRRGCCRAREAKARLLEGPSPIATVDPPFECLAGGLERLEKGAVRADVLDQSPGRLDPALDPRLEASSRRVHAFLGSSDSVEDALPGSRLRRPLPGRHGRPSLLPRAAGLRGERANVDRDERLPALLPEEVIHILTRVTESSPAASILDLEGLGKETWGRIDTTKHVASERKSWD